MNHVQNDFVKKFQNTNPELFRVYQEQSKVKWELSKGTKYVTTDSSSSKLPKLQNKISK